VHDNLAKWTKAMRLIVFTGLPGAGKSAVAEALGRELNIPVFAKDWLEATLRRCRLQPDPQQPAAGLGYAGYELLTTLAERQLRLGQSAILDSVASPPAVREQWRALAGMYQAGWFVIEAICSDESLHRQRLSGRRRGIPGWYELSWADVEKVKLSYTPWSEDRLVLDAVQPLALNVTAAVAYVSG
jgi:predicted kinase